LRSCDGLILFGAKSRAVMQPSDRQVEVRATRLRRPLRCTKGPPSQEDLNTSYDDEEHKELTPQYRRGPAFEIGLAVTPGD
jgi:hypothetical protein